MKEILFVTFCIFSLISAQTESSSDVPPVVQSGNGIEITQNWNITDMKRSYAVYCYTGFGKSTRSTKFYQMFTLNDFGIFEDFKVSLISFAIQRSEGGSLFCQDVNITLYYQQTNDQDFVYEDLQLIETVYSTLPDINYDFFHVNFQNAIVPANTTLVVEFSHNDGAATQSTVNMGMNTAREGSPSWMYAPRCNITHPSTMTSLGEKNTSLIWIVSNNTDIQNYNDIYGPKCNRECVEDTCTDFCGFRSCSGCWCDGSCETTGDCCTDRLSICSFVSNSTREQSSSPSQTSFLSTQTSSDDMDYSKRFTRNQITGIIIGTISLFFLGVIGVFVVFVLRKQVQVDDISLIEVEKEKPKTTYTL
eukprot:TRINITY_DN1201_c0_g1_i1.p1 TRINITY_DN1201_c0_g1~~TRINITY_DN1201_c0_g1_i1.p1  ORF type:complete len:370 (-),score=50.63 TRINITY_DN1201_c0_g1_i1:26-1111(-)